MLIRPLTDADATDSHNLRHEAFGNPRISGPSTLPGPGQRWLGAFDGATLAGRLVVKEYESFFGGAPLRTAGIGGVTVAAEHRGAGLLTPLLARALAEAREAGEVVSTLFPTASGIYRRFGYELFVDKLQVTIPTPVAAAVRRPEGVTLRRAVAADAPAIRDCYTRWAREQNGPLTRRGPMFPGADDALLGASGVSLAERDGALIGYASWNRSAGYGDYAYLDVEDLIADDRDALAALIAMLGSFGAVAGELRLSTSGMDPVRALLPHAGWAVGTRNPYMLRLLDVGAAFGQRCWPDALELGVRFRVQDSLLAANDGLYELAVSGGRASCVRVREGRDDEPTFTAAGLAGAFSGAWSCEALRRAGLLRGDRRHDALLNLLLGGRPAHIRDYF